MKKYLIGCIIFLSSTLLWAQPGLTESCSTPSCVDSALYNRQWRACSRTSYFVKDNNAILDQIERDAIDKHNAYQLFRTHFVRVKSNYPSRWDASYAVMYLDSMMKQQRQLLRSQESEITYACLYNYLIANLLLSIPSNNLYAASSHNTNLSQLDSWTGDDFKNAARQYFQHCFDSLAYMQRLPAEDFSFMLKPSSSVSNLRLTLCDLLIQDALEKQCLTDDESLKLIDSALNWHHLPEDRSIMIDYELCRMRFMDHFFFNLYDTSYILKFFDRVEEKYGQDEAINYYRGLSLLMCSDISENKNELIYRAVSYFDKVILEGNNSFYVNNARYHRETVTHPYLEMSYVEKSYAPSAKLRVPISYANIDSLYVSVYTYRGNQCYSPYLNFKYNAAKQQNVISQEGLKRLKKCVQKQFYVLKQPVPYAKYTSEIWLDSLPAGKYAVLFHTDEQWDSTDVVASAVITVSNIAMSNTVGNEFNLISLQNRTTGAPLKYKKLVFNNSFIRYTDKNGDVKVNLKYCPCWVKVRDGKDVFFSDFDIYHKYRYSGKNRYRNFFNPSELFTDRTLYRPGQTLYFKVVYCTPDGKIKENSNLCVTLIKKDGYSIALGADTVHVTTSDFGSASGQLKLPQQPGEYKVLFYELNHEDEIIYCRNTIEIAEYKLPSFRVKLEEDTSDTASGDTLYIRGTAESLTGVPLTGAFVNLTISSSDGNGKQKAVVTTDDKGRFVYPYKTANNEKSFSIIDVQADVTDLNGENHSQSQKYFIRQKAFNLGFVLGSHSADKAQRDTLRWLVMPKNANGILLANPIEINVSRLKEPKTLLDYLFEDYPLPDQLLYSKEEYLKYFPHSTFDATVNNPMFWEPVDTVLHLTKVCRPDSLLLVDIHDWEPGTYSVTAYGVSRGNDTINYKDCFHVYDSRGVVPAKNPLLLAVNGFPDTSVLKRKDTVDIILSSCLADATVLCHVFQGDRKVSTLCLKTDGKLMHIPFVFHSEYGSLYVNATLARENKVYSSQTEVKNIMVPQISQREQKKIIEHYPFLSLNLTHWNKVVEPGQQNEWELSVSRVDDSCQSAELLAWMVDCSLYELDMDPMQPFLIPKISSFFRNPKYLSRNSAEFYLDIEDDYFSMRKWNPVFHNPYELEDKKYNAFSWYMQNNYVRNAYSLSMFCEDNTSSSRLGGENVRKTPGRSVHAALSSLDGASNRDGVLNTVRGNRSDGSQTIVDGVRVRSEESQNPEMSDGEQTEEDTSHFVFSPNLKIRSDFKETAFFYPQLRTDEQGKIKMVFTVPDQYTRWQFLAVAHTKEMKTGVLSAFVRSMQTLILQTNAPRFFREADTVFFKVKISNVKDTMLSGTAVIRFFDAATGEPLSLLLQTADSMQSFSCKGQQNTMLEWKIAIPAGVSAIGYRVLAQSGGYGDGEEKVLPVLPKRQLVTEAIHFTVSASEDTAIVFQHLLDNSSSSLQHYSYTMEVATNPLWYAVRSLPYLMQYGYESNDQIFAKLYANAIARHIVKHNPLVAEMFEKWSRDTLNRFLESPLRKNEDLKSVMLEETPWVNAAQQEKNSNYELSQWFNLHNLDNQWERQYRKLAFNQTDGGWSWYGKYGFNYYITTCIVAGYRKLQHLGIDVPSAKLMLDKAIRQLDSAKAYAYRQYQKELTDNPKAVFYFSPTDLDYLYARSFGELDSNWLKQDYVQHLFKYALQNVHESSLAQQAKVALILHRTGRDEEAQRLMEALRQRSFLSKNEGMYWKQDERRRESLRGYRYRSYMTPVETQSLLIEAFAEISPRKDELKAMKQWLLARHEGNHWANTKATSEAVYALLLNTENLSDTTSSINIADDLLSAGTETGIQVGNDVLIPSQEQSSEVETGYRRFVWLQDRVTEDLAKVTVHTDSVHPCFGACYWQYFDDFDKIEAASGDMSVTRTFYHQRVSDDRLYLDSVTAENPIRLGEKILVRLIVRSDRDLEYVHVKDLRAAAFEPTDVREHYVSQNGLSYVSVPHDASVSFFITTLPKGTYIIDYELVAAQTGSFLSANAIMECMYNPSFRSQTPSARINIVP